jgi:hypothetical protein
MNAPRSWFAPVFPIGPKASASIFRCVDAGQAAIGAPIVVRRGSGLLHGSHRRLIVCLVLAACSAPLGADAPGPHRESAGDRITSRRRSENQPRIDGEPAYRTKVTRAIEVIRDRCPEAHRLVTAHLPVISERPCAVRSRGCRCDAYAISAAAADGSPTWVASSLAREAYLRAARAESNEDDGGSESSEDDRRFEQAGAVVRVSILRALSAPLAEIEWATQMAEPTPDHADGSVPNRLGSD